MLLFLADVGFKIHNEVPTEPSLNKTDGPPSQSPPIAEIKAHSNIVEQPQGATSLAGRSALLKTLNTEKQIQDVLDGAIIENPKMEIAKGGIPTQKQAKILEGKYLGYVRFLDDKRENLSVIWDLQPDYSKSRLSGMFHLSIHGPGQDSESNGRGDIDSIVSLAADKDGFLVNACGDRCYLQLYYNSSADEFFGNYYEMPKGSLSSKPARLGIIALKK